MPIIRVALDVPVNTLFDYIAPSATIQHVGVRVQVPFGRKMVIGIIIEVTTDSSFAKGKLRSAKYIFNDIPPLPKSLLDLFKFCSEYYHYPLGEIVMSGLPTRLRDSKPFVEKPQVQFRFHITNKGRLVDTALISKRSLLKHRLLALFRESRVVNLIEIKQLSTGAVKVLKEFVELGWVEESASEFKTKSDIEPVLRKEQAIVVNDIQHVVVAWHYG